jgi:hypothetical protein
VDGFSNNGSRSGYAECPTLNSLDEPRAFFRKGRGLDDMVADDVGINKA